MADIKRICCRNGSNDLRKYLWLNGGICSKELDSGSGWVWVRVETGSVLVNAMIVLDLSSSKEVESGSTTAKVCKDSSAQQSSVVLNVLHCWVV